MRLRYKLTSEQRRELQQLTITLHHLQDVEAQAVIGQELAKADIEAILDRANEQAELR